VHGPAATRAGGRCEIDRHLRTLEMAWQALALTGRGLDRTGGIGQGRGLGLDPGDVGVEVFQAELQLVAAQTLRAAPEPAALERLHDLP
jgi:hypothetical protein